MSIHTILACLSEAFDIKSMSPFGIELIARDDQTGFQTIHPSDVRALITSFRIMVVRQGATIPQAELVECAQNIGPLLPWDFGVVMEMRVHEAPQNYLFTNGPVPFHWDGAFYKEPRYLLFHCLEAPSPQCGGETLFTNTHFIWEQASAAERADWMTKTIRYKTEKRAHYGGDIAVPMVQTHPDTGETILRFAEPVPDSMLNPVEIRIDGFHDAQTAAWLKALAPRLYHEAHCYQHTWESNDVVLADNVSLLHARKAFREFSPRFLQRIQIL